VNATARGVSAAAPSWRAYLSMTGMELRLATRRGENLLVTLGIPAVLLVFLANVELVTAVGTATIDLLVPGILALAVLSTGMVALGISTAFERSSGVLKRLGGSPLPTWALIGAKTTIVTATVMVQVVLVVVIGWLLGWDPPIGIPETLAAAAPWLLLGTLASAGIGLVLAGRLRAETVLAVANGLYVLALVAGGVIVPLDRLPPIVAVPASILPPALIADLLRGAMVPGASVMPVEAMALLLWAVGLLAAAARTFRLADER
jgi:ABC-2 type transport system permease protein